MFPMRITLLILVCSTILFQGCKNKTKSPAKLFYDKQFNWTIEIPEGFESVSSEEWTKMQNKGAEAIEKTYEGKIENNSKVIFVFKSGQYDYFESNYQVFDSTLGTYMETVRGVNDLLFGTFEAQMPGASLDSNSFEETIDGKLFQGFKVSISLPNNFNMEALTYNRLFGNKEFSVNIITMNKEKQKSLLNAFKNSKFDAKKN